MVEYAYVKDYGAALAHHDEEALKILNGIFAEVRRRMELLASKRVAKIQDYNELVPEERRLPYLALIIDEMSEIVNKDILHLITRIVSLASALGVSVIAATQRPDTDSLPSRMKAMMQARICLQVSDQLNSRMILGDNNPEAAFLNPKIKGRAIYKFDELLEVQLPHLPLDKARKILNKKTKGGITCDQFWSATNPKLPPSHGLLPRQLILEALDRHKLLSRSQIEHLFFTVDQNGEPLKSGKRICQRRLASLRKRKLIYQTTSGIDDNYCYYLDKNVTKQKEHLLGVNWAVLYRLKKGFMGEQLYSVNYEVDNEGILRTDAILGFKNNFKPADDISFYFIEFEMGHLSNEFNKVEKYNTLFNSPLNNCWWAKKTKQFPDILIVTANTKQILIIREKIKTKNENDLVFKVLLLDTVIREVLA